MIQSLAFLAYPVSDLARSRHFYEEVLGLKLTHEAMGERFEYDRFVRHPGKAAQDCAK